MEVEGGATATFTMTAFTPVQDRALRIHGTKGCLEARIGKRTLDFREFWEDNRHTHVELPEAQGAHGGADAEVMRRLIQAVQLEDPSSVTTSTYASLQSHAIVFAVERSRRTGAPVELRDFTETARR